MISCNTFYHLTSSFVHYVSFLQTKASISSFYIAPDFISSHHLNVLQQSLQEKIFVVISLYHSVSNPMFFIAWPKHLSLRTTLSLTHLFLLQAIIIPKSQPFSDFFVVVLSPVHNVLSQIFFIARPKHACASDIISFYCNFNHLNVLSFAVLQMSCCIIRSPSNILLYHSQSFKCPVLTP